MRHWQYPSCSTVNDMKNNDPASLLQRLRALQQEAPDGMLDVEQVQLVTEALLEHYRLTADAAAFDNPLEGPHMLAKFAALHAGVTLATLSSRDLEETLFDVIPAKVSVGSEIAQNIVDTTHAFYVWLKREHALEQADDIIELLGNDAVRELEQQMDDPSNFGPAKAMMMQAIADGVDLSSKEAIDAFMLSQLQAGAGVNTGSAGFYADPFHGHGDELPSPLTPEQQRANQKKRKKNRKASRKARKKNR